MNRLNVRLLLGIRCSYIAIITQRGTGALRTAHFGSKCCLKLWTVWPYNVMITDQSCKGMHRKLLLQSLVLLIEQILTHTERGAYI